MTAQRPGIRHSNKAKELLNNLSFDETPYAEDIKAATAYALLAIADALGDIALSARRPEPTGAVPTVESGAES